MSEALDGYGFSFLCAEPTLIRTKHARLLSPRWAHQLGRGVPLHSSYLVIPLPSIASKVFRLLFLFFRIPVNQLFKRRLVVVVSGKLDHQPQIELEQGGVSYLN